MYSIVKKYIKIGAKKVYVQVLGKGPAIALMHPSPSSSDMLLPLANKLAGSYTVICIDTPGYGNSDGLDREPESISTYTDLLHQLFTTMGISKLSLYGSATGSQLAIRFALDHPSMVSYVFLDNAAHFEDGLRTRILENYFPDLTPNVEGGHLPILWDIVSNMFRYFPWCFKTSEYYLNRPPMPATVLHAIAMDYLKAGKNYAYAYRVAFMHERAENVQKLKVPASIFRWEGSIVLPYIDALVNHEFRSNIEVINLDKDHAMRMDGMVNNIIEKSIGLLPYEMPNSLGEEFVENSTSENQMDLPEITEDGSYLLKAWRQLYKEHKTATPEEIQQLLINGYATRNNEMK